jgi:hypothetical protein
MGETLTMVPTAVKIAGQYAKSPLVKAKPSTFGVNTSDSYDGWSSMKKTCIAKGYVIRRGMPARYSLT